MPPTVPRTEASATGAKAEQQELQVAFMRSEDQVGRVRHASAARLQHWRVPQDVIQASLQVISELVTNAVQHSLGDALELHLSHTTTSIWIEIVDRAPQGRPERKEAGPLDEGGRGLWLVDAYATEHGGSWGVSDDNSVTWCALSLSARE